MIHNLNEWPEALVCCRRPVIDYSMVNRTDTGVLEQAIFCTRCGSWHCYRWVPECPALPIKIDSSTAMAARMYKQPPARFLFPPNVRAQGLKRRYIAFRQDGEQAIPDDAP